jgi:hypothetical protein
VGIRQTINENPAGTAAVTGGIVVLAILFIIWQACSSGPGAGGIITSKAFFSTDDGKTWFVDDNANIPPFQTKDGKTAVRAQIYTCDTKTQFCGYLEAYSIPDKQMLEAAKAANAKGSPPPGGPMGGPMGYPGQPMVKRPGAPANAWVPMGPATMTLYQQVIQVRCPNGSTDNLAKVFPE